jgi:hypothetical protein
MNDATTLERPEAVIDEPSPHHDDSAAMLLTPETMPVASIRTYAGVPVSTLVLGSLLLLMLLWSAWATRELLALKSHRTVSVSLATLVRDFVAAEARNGGTPEATTARTRIYIATIGGAVKSMADDGNTVLVSEAVLGNSVPDVTPQLKAAVDAKLRSLTPAATGAVNGF